MSAADAARAIADAAEIELVTRGRMSGRDHAVRVWCAYEDGHVWLRTDRGTDWYRNLRHDPRCRLRVGALEVAGTREAVPDEAAALRHVVALFRAKYGTEWVADWYVDRGRVPVRIRLDT